MKKMFTHAYNVSELSGLFVHLFDAEEFAVVAHFVQDRLQPMNGERGRERLRIVRIRRVRHIRHSLVQILRRLKVWLDSPINCFYLTPVL